MDNQGSGETPQKSPREVYEGLRAMALSTRPEQLGLSVGPNEPYIGLMEIGLQKGCATIVGVLDGTASIYFSNGGGYIGGSGHESISNAAIEFVEALDGFVGEMLPASDFPFPSPGEIFFYAVTPSGVFTTSDDEDALELGQSALTPLFYAGNRLITEYRKISNAGEHR
jgi:hypothetical protein